MTTQSSVAILKQRFEYLFPGKWVNADTRQKTLLTGLSAIDHSFSRGVARKRITEWTGPLSSGKTSILRTIISYWCASGFDIAYIDAENRLVAADWAFVQENKRGAGKFWVIRNLDENKTKTMANQNALKRNHFWAADELIRTNAFDVVVLDLGSSECTKPIGSRIYARLQNSLDKSKTAMIIVRDTESHDHYSSPGWGCHVQLSFHWGENVKCIDGLNGKIMITPSVNYVLAKNGLSQSGEVSIVSNVTNRLFTHPSVPDRRTPKTGKVQKL